MKIDNKKKKVIIIAVAVILIAAMATTVGILCSKKSKGSEDTETPTVTVEVTDENGETVTDENGNAVTETETAPETTKKNSDKKNSKNNSNPKQENNNGKSETTEPTTEYTTKSPMDANMGYDQMLDDDIVLTSRNGLLALQDYYGDKYVVNYDEPNAKDGIFAYAVFEKDGDHKKIIYWVTAEEATGKAIQTDEKGKTKDITKQLKKFYW